MDTDRQTEELRREIEKLRLRISELENSGVRLSESERAQCESEENFRNFFETIDDMIIVATEQGRILYTNRALSEKLGYGAEKIAAMNLLDFHAPDKRQEAEQIFAEMLRGERNTCPLPLQSETGTVIPVETRMWFGKWNGVNCTFGVCKDLSKEQEALQKFDRLFNGNPALMAVTGIPDNKFVEVNESFLNSLGYSREEVIGKTLSELEIFIRPDMREAISQEIEKGNSIRQIELKAKKRDGVIVDGLFSGEVVESQGKKVFISVMIDISDRKRAEKLLLESERNFAAAFKNSPVAMTVMSSVTGKYVDVNDVFLRETGYTREEVIGRSSEELQIFINCPEPADLILQGFQFGREMEVRMKSGEIRNCLIYMAEIQISGLSHFLSSIVDITDRKRAEEELRQAKEYAEAILDSLPATFYVFDENLRLIRWNKNFEDVTGYAPDELLNMRLLEFIDEEDRDNIARQLEATLIQGAGHAEGKAFTKSGHRIPYLFTGVWRIMGNKQYLLGTGIDISERKRTEDLLRKNEQLFRKVFETAPDPVSISKLATGIYVDVNRSFSEITGYGREELIGRSSLELNMWRDPQIRNEIVQALAETGFVRNIQSTFVTRNGDLKTALLSAGSIMLDGEEHLLAIVKDISELKKAETERLKLERQVQHAQKLESLGVLAGGIAHDLNNILTGILGNADLALMRLSASDRARGNLEEIRTAALRAAGLANQMLAYSGKGKFELRFIDLSGIVKEMAQLLDVSISKKAVLIYDLADNLPPMEGDVNQIRQVVMNLITNASESLDPNSGVIRLSTSAAFCDRNYLEAISEGFRSDSGEPLPEGMYVSLEVTDSGCGMDEETQDKVFDPFFTTKFSGRGLGMAAVLGIVRGHKGVIKIYSEIGKGTTFKVLFPANPGLEAAEIHKTAEEDFPEFLRKGFVLVADDEETVCSVAKEMLEDMGLTVLTASDGNKAVEVFRGNVDKIMLVLLDLTMPGLDGAQVFQEMRCLKPQIKVILSSGYNEQDVTHRFVGKGLAGFIQKPYTLAKLREKMHEVLRTG